MSQRIIICFIFTLISTIIFQQSAYAESQVVSATGVAPFTPGGEAKAKDMAIQDAMRKAVEQAVGTMVAAETMVSDYQVLRDNVFTKTQGYIQKYDVANAGPKGNLYEVTISATVAVENLKNDLAALGLLHARVEKPRVLFMIAEQNIGQEFIFWWHWWGDVKAVGQQFDMSASETAMKEEFINKGFNIVDISVATGKIDISNAYRIADLTDTGAKEIGRKLGAEIVVKGKALAKAGPRTPGSSVGSYLADITASVIRVDNGAVLASARGHGVSRHISEVTGGTEALERAARELSGKMIDQISAKWTQEVQAGGLIQITVRGIEEYSDLANFKDTIKAQIRGVNAVYQRSVEGGEATIEVDYKGSAQQLADEISKKKFKEIPKLKVRGATANTIEISFGGTAAQPTKPVEAPPAPEARPAAQAVQAAEDKHWIQPDDYFISERPYEHGWIYISLAKMKQPSTAKTKGEAQFFRLHDSKDLWAKYFWKTRPSEEADIQIGALVICFEGNNRDNIYHAPENKNSARTANWFMGRVTDTSDLYKGAVRIDTYSCSPEALRVPAQ
ncbi:MAG: hypothetical protein HY026_05910 [Deltaproteobacteria bacterium]|nr:hypothetical protein [Deltaproteobacteria bacterium]